MKHEPTPRRDQREIVVPGDMRPNRASGHAAAARRPARAASVPPGEMRAALGAVLGWAGRTCLARPGEVAGTVIALGAVAYVSANALGFQAGRHPAPILPQPALATGASPKAALPKAGVATAKPAEAAAAQKPETVQPEKAAARDAIGDILRSADEAATSTASVSPRAETPKPDKGVMKAQRALAKLGYAGLKPDGVMGPATRTAIEKFERERKLPVTGEAAGRTLRELAARASAAKG